MISQAFLSMASAIFWFLVFAVSCGVATFIESYYDTATAWAMVYGSLWFGLVQFILGINLAYNIYKYKLIAVKKLPVLIFHVGFLFILLGSIATRYLGVEGLMHIRNGGSSNEIETAMSYMQLKIIDENRTYMRALPMYISKAGRNYFTINQNIGTKKATLEYSQYVPNAAYKWVPSQEADANGIMEIMFSNENDARTLTLPRFQSVDAGNLSISFDANVSSEEFIKFSLENDKFYLQSNLELNTLAMGANESKKFAPNEKIELGDLAVYSFESGGEKINFAIKTKLAKAKRELVSLKEGGTDALKAVLSYDGKQENVDIFIHDKPTQVVINNTIFEASFNPMKIKLPFSIELEKFEMLRYSGSSSPMSYSSFVKVNDGDKSYPYHIYMNHVLDHGGYRFFQSSYDRDEQGTVLSVNQDPGKMPTYIGYFLLCLGMFLNFLNPHSRFMKLSKLIIEQNAKYTKALLLAGFIALFGLNTNLEAQILKAENIENAQLPKVDSSHAQIAKTLIVQSNDGRMKPFDTLSHELLNKLYRSNSFNGMKANETVLSMLIAPSVWRFVPIVKISDERLRQLLGLKDGQKYASFNDFFVINGEKSDYKLLAKSEEANRKPLSARTTLDKEIIKADEKVNILYMIFSGEILRIFPAKNDETNTWHSPESAFSSLDENQKKEVLAPLQNYFKEAEQATISHEWDKANEALGLIKTYQAKFGAEIMPKEGNINAELAFNKYNIFGNLVGVYLLAGFALLIVVFIRLASNLRLNAIFKVVYAVNILAFIAHTIGLALRWYISGHAPWSDSYESLVYIAWALALSGIVFSRRSAISLALTAILAGCVLFVAHLSWIDPQITNLKPVLRSYWLTIHVSVITASYGFLGLCSLLGIFSLVLMGLQRKIENPRLAANILEATRINEMAMILGLCLLTAGNFLGGVWANESWGRYWGWDSKETWALISILVYAALLHMRFVKQLNSQYAFAVASMFAYWVIVFTYFGVNFYLTGMHSYAAGDAVQVPAFVYVIAILMVLLAFFGRLGKKYDKTL